MGWKRYLYCSRSGWGWTDRVIIFYREKVIQALKRENDPDIVEEARDKLLVIRDKVGIFVLNDLSGETDTQNVFSWNVSKYLGDE